MNTHEKPWAPRRTHEFTCIPVMFSCFFEPMQLANYMFNHCLYNFRFSILFVWSCVLIQGVFLCFCFYEKNVCLLVSHHVLAWHPENISIAIVAKQNYTYTNIYIYICKYIYMSIYIYIYIDIVFCIQRWFAPSNTMSLDNLIFSQQNVKNVIFNFSWWEMAKCSQGVDVPNASR